MIFTIIVADFLFVFGKMSVNFLCVDCFKNAYKFNCLVWHVSKSFSLPREKEKEKNVFGLNFVLEFIQSELCFSCRQQMTGIIIKGLMLSLNPHILTIQYFIALKQLHQGPR